MIDMDIPLPQWLTHVEDAPGTYLADPDIFYPALLARMEINPEDATRHDLETALGLVKRYAGWVTRQANFTPCKNLVILGNEGRKGRWNIATFPLGDKPDISGPLQTGERNSSVSKWWKKLMGPIGA